MRLTFTVVIDEIEKSGVTVVQDTVKPTKQEVVENKVNDLPVPPKKPEHKEDKFVPTREWIGEGHPNGRGWYNKVGEADMPYCAAQVKDLLTKLNVPISAVGKAIGMDPARFRNLLRIDARGFSEEDYNVIMKAAQEVRAEKDKEIM